MRNVLGALNNICVLIYIYAKQTKVIRYWFKKQQVQDLINYITVGIIVEKMCE